MSPLGSPRKLPAGYQKPCTGRRARFLITIVLFAGLGICLFGAFQPEGGKAAKTVVVSGALGLLGPKGTLVGSLYLTPEGWGRLSFFDGRLDSRLTVGVAQRESPAIAFVDSGARPRISTYLDTDGAPRLWLGNPETGTDASVRVSTQGIPETSIEKGKASVSVSSLRVGPSLSFKNMRDESTLGVSFFNDQPSILLMEKGRVVRSSWVLLKDGYAALNLFDSDSMNRFSLSCLANGDFNLRFVNPAQKP